jgi:hypothetical protein
MVEMGGGMNIEPKQFIQDYEAQNADSQDNEQHEGTLGRHSNYIQKSGEYHITQNAIKVSGHMKTCN